MGELSRKQFYLFLFSAYLGPFFCAFAFHRMPITIFLGLSGCASALFLIQIWEKKLKRSVSQLVQAKIESLKEAPLNEAEMEKIHKNYQKEIENLYAAFEEQQRGYEHQIDLLHSSHLKSKDKVEELAFDMDKRMEEIRRLRLESEDFRKEYVRLQEELDHIQKEAGQQLSQKETLLKEYQHTISEQRMIIEKKQRYVAKLEGKVRDLMYEIRSLLQLEEAAPPQPAITKISLPVEMGLQTETLEEEKEELQPSTSQAEKGGIHAYDLSLQLQRYIEHAQSFMGVEHLGYVGGKSPRFLDLTFESYAIDLRRLFDSFREETSGVIFVYSPVEGKFLFVNNFVKTLLGWSPEKFMKDFSHLVQMGHSEWVQTLGRLQSLKEGQIRLVIRSREGEDLLCHCFLGIIAHGPFVNQIIGIMSPLQ